MTEMTASELISLLQSADPSASVHMAYDSNIVTTQPVSVHIVQPKEPTPDLWHEVKAGDVVLLSQ